MNSPVQKRAWHYKQEKVRNVRIAHLRNHLMKVLAIVLPILAIGLFTADRLGRSDLFLIDEIEYRGAFKYADQADIDAVTKNALNGNFFTIDLLAVQRAIMTIPWVEAAYLGREWPNKIVVIIDEYEPIMRWADGGLVMQKGELVKTDIQNLVNASELQALPSLDGRPVDLPEMLAKYAFWQYELTALGMVMEELSLSESKAWTLRLRNVDAETFDLHLGTTNANARFQRFIRLFSQGENYFKQLEYIDARYPNGVVVKRRPEEINEPSEVQQQEGETDA